MSAPSVLVAAVNASPNTRDRADYACDGVGDQVEIQAANDYLAIHGGGKLQMSEGDFYFLAGFKQDRAVWWDGQGWGTHIRAGDGMNANVAELRTPTVEWARITNIWFDGNKSKQTRGHGVFWNQTGSGFNFSYSDPLHVVRDNLFTDFKEDGLRWIGGAPRGCELVNNAAYRNDGNNFTIQGSDNKIVDNVGGHAGLVGLDIGPSAGFTQVVNNKMFGSGRIDPSVGWGIRTISTFGTLVGNHAQDNTKGGYALWWTDVSGSTNTADSNGTPTTPGYGMEILGSRVFLEVMALVDANGVDRKQGYGLHIGPDASKVVVSGYTFNNISGPVLNQATQPSTIDLTGLRNW